MVNDLIISNLNQTERESAYQVFETSIPDAFEKEGLASLKEDINSEITHKKHMLDVSLGLSNSEIRFFAAKLEGHVIGTISFGPCSEDIRKFTDNHLNNIGELGSLYILPNYQNQGVGSALINGVIMYLYKQGIKKFCLDSGYKRAQERWLRKFGEPYKVLKDYWGPGSDHMIWLCGIEEFISR